VEVNRPRAKNQENKSAKPIALRRRRCGMLWNVSAGANGDVFMLQLSLLVQTQFHLAIETLMYTCGNSVLPEGHPMATVFVLQCPSGKTALFV